MCADIFILHVSGSDILSATKVGFFFSVWLFVASGGGAWPQMPGGRGGRVPPDPPEVNMATVPPVLLPQAAAGPQHVGPLVLWTEQTVSRGAGSRLTRHFWGNVLEI